MVKMEKNNAFALGQINNQKELLPLETKLKNNNSLNQEDYNVTFLKY